MYIIFNHGTENLKYYFNERTLRDW